jgi:hypothetical protein
MEFKKLTRDIERANFFKNIAMKATDQCLKSFDSNEVSEDEEKCLKKAALNLYSIVERNRFEQYVVNGYPAHPW